MEEDSKMIDLHNHILYGQDDGAETLEESIRMCRISSQDGVRTIVATPHILPGIYENDRSTILSQVAELNSALKKLNFQRSPFRVKNLDSMTQLPDDLITELRILAGADVHFSSDLLERLERKEVVTVNDQGRY